MALPESRKKANAKWDKENMSTIGCKVKKDVAEAFKKYCAQNGKTANEELKSYVMRCIEKAGE